MSGAMLNEPEGRPFFEQLEPRLLLSSDGISAMAVQLFAGLTTTSSTTPVYVPLQRVTNAGGDVTPSTEESIPLISMDDFRADERFDGIDGSGLAVVILDTGLDVDHPFFGPDLDSNGIADRIVYQWDFADNDGDASDFHDHGSNVTSIVAGSQDPGFPDYPGGMAGGADIIHLKVFESASGAGYFSYIESALQWVVLNVTEYNIASVNMSLSDGGKYTSQQTLYGLGDELAALSNLDVVVASASGNSYYNRVNRRMVQGVAYPSADPNSLSIGAVYDEDSGHGWQYGSGAIAYTTGPDRITPFTQRDDELTTVMAPGAPITGADRNGGMVTFHGTSQASPHVAGIAALAQQLAVQQIGRRLTTTEFADLLGSTGVTINDGDDENDNVKNTGLDFPRVDMLALGNAILAMNTNTNTSPVAAPDAYDVSEGQLLQIPAPGVLANDTDPEGDPLTSVLANGPSHAAAFTFNDDGSFTYTPDAGYTGPDSFTYSANDGALDSNEATVTITVLPGNNAPSFTSTPVTNATSDALYSYSIAADDPDVGDSLTITAPTLPGWLNLLDNGDGTAMLSGTPPNEDIGDNPVTLRVTDALGATDDQPFTVTVAATDVIVDNTSATVTGDWLTTTHRPNYYDTDYLHDKNKDKGSNSVTFTPALAQDGQYEVYMWWPNAPIWATNVPVDVTHDGGTSTVSVDESTNGGRWNLVGTYDFTAGTGGVTIRTDGTKSHVAADAVRFLRLGDIAGLTVTVDPLTTADPTPELTGTVSYPAATVEVTVDGNSYAATNNVDGTWTLADDTISPALALGTYDVAASADIGGTPVGDSTTDELEIVVAPTDVIVDNASASVTGDWLTSTYRPNYYDTNYLHDKNKNKGSSSVTFTPVLAQDGRYEVYLWWPEAPIWATNVPVDVTHDAGTHTVSVDESTNGGQWNLVGTYDFTAGTGGVTIRTDGTTSHVAADAVRFLRVGDIVALTVTVDPLTTADTTPELTGTVSNSAATVQVTVDGNTYAATNNGDGTWTLPDDTISPALALGTYDVAVSADTGGTPVSDGTTDELEIVAATTDVIVDNTSATVTGDWLTTTYRPNYYDTDYLHDKNTGKGDKSVTFTPDLPEDGPYEVYLWWPDAPIWATNVPVDVTHDGGTSTVSVDESINGGQWNLIGTYDFTAGTGSVTIRTDGTTSHVAVDAVRFLRVGDI